MFEMFEESRARWSAVPETSFQRGEERTGGAEGQKETVKKHPPRFVALPSLVVDELRRYRVRQAEQLLKLDVRLTDDHPVCAREDGEQVWPSSLTRAFRTFMRRHRLPQIRLHDLRHSHATHLLAAGVHPKIAQERLGHSSISITLDTYSHVMPGMQEDAVAKVDAAIQAAMNKRETK